MDCQYRWWPIAKVGVGLRAEVDQDEKLWEAESLRGRTVTYRKPFHLCFSLNSRVYIELEAGKSRFTTFSTNHEEGDIVDPHDTATVISLKAKIDAGEFVKSTDRQTMRHGVESRIIARRVIAFFWEGRHSHSHQLVYVLP